MDAKRVRYQINGLIVRRLGALYGADYTQSQKGATAAVCLRVWAVKRLPGLHSACLLTRNQAKEVYDDP